MDTVNEIAERFKALSDPTRLRILRMLHHAGHPICVNGLVRHLGITQSAVSQHLRILKQTGLVDAERHGNFMHYRIREDALERVELEWRTVFGKDSA